MQRHLRLRLRADFARLRQIGHTWRHRFFILSVTPNNLPHNRYGFVASKQVGNAVKRNRIRRLLRESVRCAHPDLVPGYDMVLIARKDIVGQSYADVNAGVRDVLQRAGLWAEHST
ncbi:MAG: ribonuclease P protein component [Anaerolineae bacterium]|nr:ribonuclease P protein component [Anaerolineae bacterium]